MNKFLKGLLLSFAFLFAHTVYAQVTVSGKITSLDKKGMEGVSIVEKGSKNGTVTNKDGKFTISVKAANAVLNVSAVNYREQSISLSGRSIVDIQMIEETNQLNEVSVTAGRQPVRKLETTQAVDIISNKLLKAIKPESFAEAVTLTPGVFANNSQGRRGGIVIRGFPDGNPLGGLVYTSILLDGLPAFGSAGRLPDAGFGFDDNVEKVEVVRGSTATVYGRSAAAGVVNIISKTGGEENRGSVKMTRYDNIHTDNNYFNYRVDWNLNGSLTKDKMIRYNIGGWFLDDRGYRKTGYNDHGYQLRGNFDFLSPDKKGKVRLGFIYADYSFQNLTDVPIDPLTNKLPFGWRNTSTYIFPALQNVNYSVFGIRSSRTLPRPGGQPVLGEDGNQIVRNIGNELANANTTKNLQLNFSMDRDLGNNWHFENKFRYQALSSGTKYPFPFGGYYNSNNVARLMLDGDAPDDDMMNEARIKKTWEKGAVKHNFQLGYYFSSTNLRPTTYSYTHFVNPGNASDLKLINSSAPPLAQRGAITRRGNYTEQVNALFAGHEMKFNDKFTMTVGLRYDWLYMDLAETKAPFDSAITRKLAFGDYSASIGFNYLFDRSTSVYANFNRAYRMPDYSAFTSLEFIAPTANNATASTLSRLPNGLAGNEIIISAEVGLRKQMGDIGIDAAFYYNSITNRLASIFENGLLVSKPFGSNRIMGAELSISYNPSQFLKGLSVRSSLTLQNATFSNFKISNSSAAAAGIIGRVGTLPSVDVNGNLFGLNIISEGNNQTSIDVIGKKLPGVPDYIWNSTALYQHKWFGLDLSANVNGKRYADATNLVNLGGLTVINAGGYFRYTMKDKKEVRIGLQVKNLGNREGVQGIAGLSENSTALGQIQATPTYNNAGTPIWAQGYLQLPRRWIAYISFDF